MRHGVKLKLIFIFDEKKMRIATTIIALFFIQGLIAQVSIEDCLKFRDLKIVVIGSSTAQGAGASVPDSAWVNRFRKYVQAINPENEVVNLAVGGYNTYRLMPHEFIPPNGRPTTDSIRNITAAIAQNPNAIILNLPSNDASSGFSVTEQLSNFDSIARVAATAEIPIWIATTQPKNFNNSNLVNVQTEVRDSILSWFDVRAIDFWNGLANSGGELDANFDSGDGTHLNDAGHRLLFERVVAKNIGQVIAIHPTLPDYEIIDFLTRNEVVCSGDANIVEVVYSNFGQSFLNDELELMIQSADSTAVQNMETPATCELDTLRFEAISNEMTATIFSDPNNEQNLTNNESQLSFEVLPSPELMVPDFGICTGNALLIQPTINESDRIFWFENEDSMNPISTDSFFNTGPLTETTSFWVEAFNGETFFKNQLFTTDQFNRDWNGIMFDIVAAEDLTVDSFSVNMFSTREQVLEIFTKSGGLSGFELDSSQWQLYKTATLNVQFPGEYVVVENLDLNITGGDTVAIYLQLQNPAADMNYLATSVNETISDSILSITNGTGITHDFAETYYPRLFSGEIFYHYGSQLGSCSSGRQEVVVEVADPQVDLGPDIILSTLDTVLTFDAGTGFGTYTWQNANTTSSIEISASDIFNSEDSLIYVAVYDEFGCMASDTVAISFTLSNLNETPFEVIQIFPNPTKEMLFIEGVFEPLKITILDGRGKVLFENEVNQSDQIDVSNLNAGVYIIRLKNEKGWRCRKIVKQ